MRFVRGLSFLLVALLVGLSPAAAKTKKPCAPFPRVVWWGDMTHESVRGAVRERYAGDWRPVIDGLTQQMSSLLALKEQDRPYAIPNTTRQLGGDQLVVYLDQVRLSLSILHCLRDNDVAAPNTAPQPVTAAPPAPAKAPGQS